MEDAPAYGRLAGIYDEAVVDPCYPDWADFLHSRWMGEAGGVHRVLDVCCGTGLLAAELINRGYEVVGTDASAAMLARARSLLGPDVVLEERALPDIGTTEVFDAAISTFDGLNYLTPEDFRRSLQAIAARVRHGGWFIFDLHTDSMMAFTYANPVVEGDSAGSHFLLRSEVDLAERMCETTIEVTDDRPGNSFVEKHRQYFHSAEQVESALADAGFVDICEVAEYSDQPVELTTLRATWIARRQSS